MGLSLLFPELHTTLGRLDGLDGAILVEVHAVDADFAVHTRAFFALDVILVDAVIDNVPLIGVGNLKHTVVGRAVNLTLVVGTQDDRMLGHLDRTKGRGGCTIGYVIVGRAGVVNRPEEIVEAVAIEHIGGFAIGIVAQRASLGGEDYDAGLVDRNHVVVEFGSGHIAVAPIEIALSADGVGEDITVNLLSPSGGRLGNHRTAGVGERTGRMVGYGHTNLLATTGHGITTEVEEVLVLAIDEFLLDTGCPSIAIGPSNLVGLEVEDGAFVLPVGEVVRGIDIELVSAPTGSAVGGRIDVVLTCLLGVEYLGVGTEAFDDGVAGLGIGPLLTQTVGLFASDGDGGTVTGVKTPRVLVWAIFSKLWRSLLLQNS